MHLHLIIKTPRKRTRDRKGTDGTDPMVQLVEALMDAIEARKHGTMDEDFGHEFHGNQYTEGAGSPKPTSTVAKGSKAAVHELLSSGHHFTMEELMEATGITNKATLTTALSDLKNPKYAGKLGALQIVKHGTGHYSVMGAKAAAEVEAAAAAAPDTLMGKQMPKPLSLGEALLGAGVDPLTMTTGTASEKKAAIALATQLQKNAALGIPSPKLKVAEPDKQIPASPAPVPDSATSPPDHAPDTLGAACEKVGLSYSDFKDKVKALSKDSGLKDLSTYTAEPMLPGAALPKELADHLYNAQLEGMATWLQSLDEESIDVLGDSIGSVFKSAKLAAMAQWAANSSGMSTKPTSTVPEVFPSDVSAAKLLADGFPLPQVMEMWKKGTAKAKSEAANKFLLPKKEAAPASVKATTPAATPKPPPGGPAFPVHTESVVPAGHKGVSDDDFNGHWEDSAFKHNTDKVRTACVKKNTDAVANKVAIQHALTERLQASPHFTHWDSVRKDKLGDTSASLSARFVNQWASNSGDHRPLSCMLQVAAQRAFGIKDEHTHLESLGSVQEHKGDYDALTHKAMVDAVGMVPTADEVKSFQHAAHDFIMAQYDHTQADLKARGIKELCLYRGMNEPAPAAPEAVGVTLQPASSFTTNPRVANAFSSQGNSIFMVRVPASQVLGSFLTGFGCTHEEEFVVLAHDKVKAVQLKYKKEAVYMDEHYINEAKKVTVWD